MTRKSDRLYALVEELPARPPRAVRPTGEQAPPRPLDGMVDWVDDAVAPSAATLENVTAMTPSRRANFGPPRRADDTTGSTVGFARAIAAALPGVTSRAGRDKTAYSVEGRKFATVATEVTLVGDGGKDRVFTCSSVGRDELRALIEDAWSGVAPKNLIAQHARARARRDRLAPITIDDIRRVVLALPGAAEGPIWGREIGFLIGTEKKTRFARFGPPIGGGIGNLRPPDDEEALVILRCPQKPELLASCPERFFTTAHFGPPDEPGGVITRLSENRGPRELAELAELLEDAWLDAGGVP